MACCNIRIGIANACNARWIDSACLRFLTLISPQSSQSFAQKIIVWKVSRVCAGRSQQAVAPWISRVQLMGKFSCKRNRMRHQQTDLI
jgi:hypothetical protein